LPLSLASRLVALLAIRLGAADFLAGNGVHHPLLVDEPFTHLDEVRAGQVWDLLCSLAADRQVIVTTQDRLVLDHLGVAPDIELTRPEPADESLAKPRPDPMAELAAPPGNGSTLPVVERPVTVGGEAPGAATETADATVKEASTATKPKSAEQAQLELG